MRFEESFLKDAGKRFLQYKELGDKTFVQLEEKDFFSQPSPESNSIAVIIQHMHGNMMSRFTNFLTEDGEKAWRKRDEEFEPIRTGKNSLVALWNTGWNCVFEAVNGLQPGDLNKIVYIRSEAMNVSDAILRQLTHYAYHTGQIVYLGKMLKDKEWSTLSIPKGQSQQFMQEMQSKK